MTNLPASEYPRQELYERVYSARGEMEKCIKEQQLALLADRTGKLMLGLHRLARWGTEWGRAQCQTMRLKLCRCGALMRITMRKVWVSLTTAYPYAALFDAIHQRPIAT